MQDISVLRQWKKLSSSSCSRKSSGSITGQRAGPANRASLRLNAKHYPRLLLFHSLRNCSGARSETLFLENMLEVSGAGTAGSTSKDFAVERPNKKPPLVLLQWRFENESSFGFIAKCCLDNIWCDQIKGKDYAPWIYLVVLETKDLTRNNKITKESDINLGIKPQRINKLWLNLQNERLIVSLRKCEMIF